MSDFVFELDTDEALASENTGGGALDTGIYDVVITSASLSKTKGGNNVVDLSFKTDKGETGLIYMAFCTDKRWNPTAKNPQGSENFNYGLWQQFVSVTGMKTGETAPYTPKDKDGKNIQKDGKDVVLTVFKEVHNLPMKLAIKKVYDAYNGEEKESNEIHSCYNKDGKALSEIIGNLPAEKIEKVAERLKDKKTQAYKNLGNASTEAYQAPQEEESTGSLLD